MNEKMRKNWKIKYTAAVFGGLFEGGPGPSIKFWRDWKYFETKKEALQHINKSLPKGGIGSQVSAAYLFERVGSRWKYVDRYWRKTEYKYEDDEKVGYPIDEIEPITVSWSMSKGKMCLF